MPSRVCAFCAAPVTGLRADYCAEHQANFCTWGTPDPANIDPPIPKLWNPGATPERMAELKAMTWPELVAHCDDIRAGLVSRLIDLAA